MTATTLHQRSSWLPMLVIALVQIQMAFNVSALVISMGAIVDDFQTSPTTIATALVVYSLGVAAFVMLGARIPMITGSLSAARTICSIIPPHGMHGSKKRRKNYCSLSASGSLTCRCGQTFHGRALMLLPRTDYPISAAYRNCPILFLHWGAVATVLHSACWQRR